jgi:glycerophosphoryl diester phosphodiesterase
VPVLFHGRGKFGGQPLGQIPRARLPRSIPSLADLWEQCGSDFDLALDMVDPGACEAVVELAARHGALDRLWLTYWHLPVLATWRERYPNVRLVYATMLAFPSAVLRRTTRRVEQAGVDALNVYHRFVGARTVATVHSSGLLLFAWGLRHPRQAGRLRAIGVDGLFVDNLATGRVA